MMTSGLLVLTLASQSERPNWNPKPISGHSAGLLGNRVLVCGQEGHGKKRFNDTPNTVERFGVS